MVARAEEEAPEEVVAKALPNSGLVEKKQPVKTSNFCFEKDLFLDLK
jgi:hypothetical protein